MKILGIDIGSSFLKAAVMDLPSGQVMEVRKFPAPEKKRSCDPYLFEVPTERYTEFVRNLLEQCAMRYEDLAGLLLSTQMHGFVYAVPGREDAYVSWQDMRCLHKRQGGEETYLEILQGQFPPADMVDCGVRIKPALALANLYTMLDEDPTLPRNGTLYTIGSYIIHDLTGRNICHETNAGPLGLLNVRKRCWNRKVIQRAGFGAMCLPELAAEDFAPCGIFHAGGREIQVFPDYGDQQIAVVGSMLRSGDGLINIATASQVGRLTRSFTPGPYEIRPYFDGEYLMTVSNMPAGRGLDVLIQFLRETVLTVTGRSVSVGDVWSGIARDFVQDTAGLRVDMTFYATADNPDGGAVTGIHQNNFHLSTLFSAAFQDMANTYQKNLRLLSQEEAMESVVCSGGVSWKRPELIHVIEKTLGCPCRLSALADEAASGLYRVGLCCMGFCADLYDKPELLLQSKDNREE